MVARHNSILFFSILVATSAFSFCLSPQAIAVKNNWAEYKNIRIGEIVSPSGENKNTTNKTDSSIEIAKAKYVSPKGISTLYEAPVPAKIECPDSPGWTHRSGKLVWFKCLLDVDSNPTYTPYGIDYPFSYMIPTNLEAMSAPLRLLVYLHPFDNGQGRYVNDVTSFHFDKTKIELHNVEQTYAGNSGGYWVYSGNAVGKPGNYNGKQISASIDYLLKKYRNYIDLEKGLHLKGTSLGGAGVMHQAMVLPKYQSNIAIVDSIIGKMMIPKNHHKQTYRSWGEELYDSVDIRLQWPKVKNIHFHWSGGSDDTLGVFDSEFIEICEQRKLSCSLTWLKSGHGLNEEGYNLPRKLWLDQNQDATLDKILPVITNNTSNYHGSIRGYHNRGISWHHSNIIDSSTEVIIPLKYNAMKNIGENVPDQPSQVSFSITPRRIKNMPLKEGDVVKWRFGQQSGEAKVGSGNEFTINNLMLINGSGYKNLVITKI